MSLMLLLLGVVPTVLSVKTHARAPGGASVTTAGLSIAFNGSAVPVSVTNASGQELLGQGSSGFYIQQHWHNGSSATFRFDTVTPTSTTISSLASPASTTTLRFEVSTTGEAIEVGFNGSNHYFTATITAVSGFTRGDGKTVLFSLIGNASNVLRGLPLNFMVNDGSGEGHAPRTNPWLLYEAPWDNSTWNPPARFAVYQPLNAATEDETLFDLWVDEGIAHPRVDGEWDRTAAKAWLQRWINATYDMSNFAMVPRNLSEWREFFPYAKMMDAKVLWFNFRVWDSVSIDDVSTKMFPTGVKGFKDFSNDALAQGFTLSTHRMSGGLTPQDPDYCVKPNPKLMGWGDMTLAVAAGPNDTALTVRPLPGVKLPTKTWGPNMSTDEYQLISECSLGSVSIGEVWGSYSSVVSIAGGLWRLTLTKGTGISQPVGTPVRGYLKGNEYYIPELHSDLYATVAERYANFSNLIGFEDGSFDGAAWFSNYGGWGFQKFASLVYQNLDHPTSVHTSGIIVSPAWLEYRFNAVQQAFGGMFTTQPADCPMLKGYVGRSQPALDEVAAMLFAGLAANTRDFTIGTDMTSTLDVYRGIGNVEAILTMVRDYKAGSFSMGPEQRQHMVETVSWKDKIRGCTITNASWMVEGPVFRKWVAAGTAHYGTEYFSTNSGVPPRFYTQTNTATPLVLPDELAQGFDRVKVIGRLLPRYNVSSPQNIDLWGKMKLGVALNLSASNPATTESWDDSRLTTYPVPTLDLSHHQGIGLTVDGDGSNGTLVVRVICGHIARDFAVPLDFVGRRWIEVPSTEQGWRVKSWGPIGMGGVAWTAINYSEVTAIAVGIGYLPAHGMSKVTVSSLQALAEIEEVLVDPTITVGDKTVKASGTLNTYDFFTLDHDGTFSTYDQSWGFRSNCSVGAFHPSNLESFEISGTPSTPPLWVEVGVSGSTETVPNPGQK